MLRRNRRGYLFLGSMFLVLFSLGLFLNEDQVSAITQDRGDTPATATMISLNQDNWGDFEKEKDIDYYKFKLDRQGTVTINLKHEYTDKSKSWNVTLYTSGLKEIKSFKSIGTTTGSTSCELGLPAGTYYIKVYDTDVQKPKAAVTYKPYQIRANFTAHSDWETEFNDKAQEADQIVVNKGEFGTLRSNKDVDYYKMEIPQNGMITVNVKHNKLEETKYLWTASIYNVKLEKLAAWHYVGNKATNPSPTLGLPRGTYYVKIENTDGSNRTCDNKYELLVNYKQMGNYETEPNDQFTWPDVLNLNTTVSGLLMEKQDVDCYKFTLQQAESVKIQFAHDSITTSKINWNGSLYNASLQEIKSFCWYGTNQYSTSDLITLQPGTYYLRITNQSDRLNREPYHLKVVSSFGLSVPSLRILSTSYNQVKLAWDVVDRADEYEISRKTGNSDYVILSKAAPNMSSLLVDSNLTTGITYTYRIRACHKGSGTYSKYSLPVSVTLSLEKPVVKSAKAIDFKSIKVSWNRVDGADGYEIMRKASKNGSYKKINEIKKPLTISFTNRSLSSGKRYYYRVRAYRIVQNQKCYSNDSNMKSAVPKSGKTTITKLKRSVKKIKLTWKKITGASGYQIYYKTSKKSAFKKAKTITKGSRTTYTHTKLKSKKTYYYRIRAYKNVSGKKMYATFSSTKKAKTK
ncbi:transglutaminase-like predicted protease domain fused ChW-repeats and cell-adhesion domain [Lachnospiraceae bacterium KM106-2]|nr:transglutaminase-like predicted protease domain fused ChW-repeats and cell-adhesion domain [Lachnospiraceae bacterium KM106-2]